MKKLVAGGKDSKRRSEEEAIGLVSFSSVNHRHDTLLAQLQPSYHIS